MTCATSNCELPAYLAVWREDLVLVYLEVWRGGDLLCTVALDAALATSAEPAARNVFRCVKTPTCNIELII